MVQLLHTLISPLFWLLLFALCLWCYLLFRPDYYLRGKWFHLLVRLYLVIWLLFFLISTPAGSKFLYRTLLIPVNVPADFAPDVIAVIPMGIVGTGDESTDFPTQATGLNLATAVRQARKFPEAYVVLFGGKGSEEQPVSHSARVMLRFMEEFDLSSERILVVTEGRRLRHFPRQIVLLEEVPPGARVGIICADWQFRRFKHDFRRAFDTVVLLPSPTAVLDARGIQWVLPREQNLVTSAGFIREWLAVLRGRLLG